MPRLEARRWIGWLVGLTAVGGAPTERGAVEVYCKGDGEKKNRERNGWRTDVGILLIAG